MSRAKAIQKIIMVCLIMVVLFGSGGCIVVNTPTPQGEVNIPIVTATEIPTQTPEPTITPTPEPRYVVKESEEVFTTAQEIMNQSEEAVAQQARIQRWLDYWIKFDNRPFAEDSADIHWKYIYDNAQKPKEVLILFEVGGEYGNKLFTVPMDENGFVDYPPTVAGSTIEAGLGPMEIEPSKEGAFLAVENGLPVRINSQGEVVEKLIQAQWEAVEKYPIDLEKLATPPKSFEELKQYPEKFVQAPNPMENFEEFNNWYNETLFEKALGGDLDKLPVNYEVNDNSIGDDRLFADAWTEKEVLLIPQFFYFVDHNLFYSSYIVTVHNTTYDFRQSYTVVMRESLFELVGDYTIADISEANRGFKVLQFLTQTNESFTEEQKTLYEQGFGTVFPSAVGEIPIGFGSIFCFNN